MEIDPHTIQQILEKVRSQLRCPQCTKRVPVTLETLKIMGDAFAVFQLKCSTCDAYILLHATIRSFDPAKQRVPAVGVPSSSAQRNFSTTLEIDPKELQALRECIKSAGGRFSVLFEEDPS